MPLLKKRQQYRCLFPLQLQNSRSNESVMNIKKILGLEKKPLNAENLQKMKPAQVQKAFFKAIRQNDQNAVGLIMDHYDDAMEWSHTSSWDYRKFYSPFIEALAAKQYDMIAFMISKGANADMAIMEKEHFPERLINRAITERDIEAVSLLIKENADLTSFANVKEWQKVANDSRMLARKNVLTPLEQAQRMADRSKDVAEKNGYALMVQMLEQAIASDMKIDAPAATATRDIQQAFFAAVQEGRPGTVDLLLEKYPDAINWTQKGVAAFEKALILSEQHKADASLNGNYTQIAESLAKATQAASKKLYL